MTDIPQKFYRLFKGSKKAHGTFNIEKTADIKQKGTGKTIRSGGAELKHWEAHITGEYGLGVIPITEVKVAVHMFSYLHKNPSQQGTCKTNLGNFLQH